MSLEIINGDLEELFDEYIFLACLKLNKHKESIIQLCLLKFIFRYFLLCGQKIDML